MHFLFIANLKAKVAFLSERGFQEAFQMRNGNQMTGRFRIFGVMI